MRNSFFNQVKVYIATYYDDASEGIQMTTDIISIHKPVTCLEAKQILTEQHENSSFNGGQITILNLKEITNPFLKLWYLFKNN